MYMAFNLFDYRLCVFPNSASYEYQNVHIMMAEAEHFTNQ